MVLKKELFVKKVGCTFKVLFVGPFGKIVEDDSIDYSCGEFRKEIVNFIWNSIIKIENENKLKYGTKLTIEVEFDKNE